MAHQQDSKQRLLGKPETQPLVPVWVDNSLIYRMSIELEIGILVHLNRLSKQTGTNGPVLDGKHKSPNATLHWAPDTEL